MDVTVRKAVDAAEPKIARAFKDQPVVEADVRDTLGTTYSLPGRAPLAIRQLRARPGAASDRSSAPTTPTRSTAATTSPSPTEPPAAPPRRSTLHEATLKLLESKLGPDHPDTLIQPQQPRDGLRSLPAASPTRSRCTRRRSSGGSRSSAPTTPTHSSAATTSPWPT